MNYYNELDPYAAQWLRNLITAHLIPDGIVDDRDIKEVRPDDLAPYTQCHFFAGIGGWSHALTLAGWPASRPVWTGSCPCQPFSCAGKRKGTADARHLWPEFYRLIEKCRPATVFGEQVASKDGLRWLDGVFADLEGSDYACGACDTCAAGVQAPHIRQRLYWVAYASQQPGERRTGGFPKTQAGVDCSRASDGGLPDGFADGCKTNGLALPRCPQTGCGNGPDSRTTSIGVQTTNDPTRCRETRRLALPLCTGRPERRPGAGERPIAGGGVADGMAQPGHEQRSRVQCQPGVSTTKDRGTPRPSAVGSGNPIGLAHDDDARPQGRPPMPKCLGERSPWSSSLVIPCRDGKARRISAQPGDEPLAYGIPTKRSDPRLGYLLERLAGLGHDSKATRRILRSVRGNRVGRLKGYGNAIVPQVAAEFIKACMP